MKGFIVGLVIGASAFAIGDKLMLTRQHTSTPTHPVLVDAGQQERRTDAHSAPPDLPSPGDASRDRAPKPVDIGSAAPANHVGVDNFPEGAQMDRRCDEWYLFKSRREQAARDAEPKDPHWSYSMEQMLEQYALGHRQGPKFQLTSVDCRTTYCEIRAIGHEDDDSFQAFQQVMNDALTEPWSDFTPEISAGGEGSGDGMHKMHFGVKRRLGN